jgi:hypothetical protein
MNITDNTIESLLRTIVAKLSKSENRDFYFLLAGSLLGFFSSLAIYYLSERKRKKQQFAEYLVELYTLGEQIKHNAFAIRFQAYPLEYYMKDTSLKVSNGFYRNENNGIIQAANTKIDERIRDRELLISKLTGKIAEHNIYFGQSEAIDEAKRNLDHFDLLSLRFDMCQSLEELEEMYNPNFVEMITKEMEGTFLKLLYDLLHKINDSVNRSKARKIIDQLKRKFFTMPNKPAKPQAGAVGKES